MPTPNRPATPVVHGNGYMTAQISNRQEWQQRALDAAAHERLLRAAGVTTPRPARPLGLTARFGAALIRLGSRLQGAELPVEPADQPAA